VSSKAAAFEVFQASGKIAGATIPVGLLGGLTAGALLDDLPADRRLGAVHLVRNAIAGIFLEAPGNGAGAILASTHCRNACGHRRDTDRVWARW
jgi:hypothetical protein